jgi:hypothetical protein
VSQPTPTQSFTQCFARLLRDRIFLATLKDPRMSDRYDPRTGEVGNTPYWEQEAK